MTDTHPVPDQVLCFDKAGRISSCSGDILPAAEWVGQSITVFPLITSISASLWLLAQQDFPVDMPNIILESAPLIGCFDFHFHKLSDNCMQLAIVNKTHLFEELQQQKQLEMEALLQKQQTRRE